MAHELILVSGPAASGKSRWAEHLASLSHRPVVYLATGPQLPDDAEWQQRLERHRQRRPPAWICREVGVNLVTSLGHLHADQVGLVDSLGSWVASTLEDPAESWQQRSTDLQAAILATSAMLVLVCEEVAWGVVPATPQGYRFRERLTGLQRDLALHSHQCWLVVMQRAINLTAVGESVPG